MSGSPPETGLDGLAFYDPFLNDTQVLSPKTASMNKPQTSAPPASLILGPLHPSLIRRETLGDIFKATCRRQPNAPCLISGKRIVTYSEFDQLSDSYAARLLSSNVKAGDYVGVCLPRGLAQHIASLAVFKLGAVYLPFDPETPMDRVTTCLNDCDARHLITNRVEGWTVNTLPLPCEDLLGQPVADFAMLSGKPDQPAYVIYTSGSSGRPKGVSINHGNICHFIRAEQELIKVLPSDRVYQGFSPAFDMWFEETWISFLAGASLCLSDQNIARAIDQLPAFINANEVTVFHTVPALMATFEEEVPGLRLINFGGEACPPSLVARFWKEGRRIFNTYGPTETTVSATGQECRPNQPVTIGSPLANQAAYIVGEDDQLVPWGEEGELWIGGPGVGQGYVNLPEMTAAKFIANPFASRQAADPILYRTGDRVRLDGNGEIIFIGRMDNQVKLRGFRIELGEIEAALLAHPGIQAAACKLVADTNGMDQLVAYIVGQPLAAPEPELRSSLSKQLPAYMVPNYFERLSALPSLPNGKVARAKLPPPSWQVREPESANHVEPGNDAELVVAAALALIFPSQKFSVLADFFNDLGGHSLLAARFISRLRQQPGFSHLSIQDLYRERTPAGLAKLQREEKPPALRPPMARPSALQHVVCGAGQAGVIFLILGFFALEFYWPYLAYASVRGAGHSQALAACASLVVLMISLPIMIAITILFRRIICLGLKPGRYPLWGWTFFRWWCGQRLLNLFPTALMANTDLYILYYRLQGMKIGRNVSMASLQAGAPEFVEIGDDVSIGRNCFIANAEVQDGYLNVGHVNIGENAFVGNSVVIAGATALGSSAELADLSSLQWGETLESNWRYGGSPAQKLEPASPQLSPAPKPNVTTLARLAVNIMFAAILFLLPVIVFLPAFPAILVLGRLGLGGAISANSLLAFPLAAAYVLLLGLEICGLRWLLFPRRIKPGTVNIWSFYYVRLWALETLMDLSLAVMHAAYATLYIVPWYRALGLRIGRRTELSTASGLIPDLVSIGAECFVADAAVIGCASIRHGVMELKTTRMGGRSFLGNSALLAQGAAVPENVLIGVLSTPPNSRTDVMKPGTTWFGTPALFLPKRQEATFFPDELTFKPKWPRVAARLVIEGFRIILPPAMLMVFTTYLISMLIILQQTLPFYAVIERLPLIYAGGVFCLLALVVASKWLIIGRYQPGEHPMWTLQVWRTEFLTAIYESIAVSSVLGLLQGTPFLPMVMRLLGCRIGARAYMDTTDITEFDCAEMGDDVALNAHCGLQTHLFEDRIMKIGKIVVADRCSIGTMSIVLCNAQVQPGVNLKPLSLVMKGETLPALTDWVGSPAQRIA